MKQKRILEIHRINSAVLLAYTIITVALLVAYLLELIKGSRSIGYILLFTALDLGPYLAYCLMYRKNKTAIHLKYILSIGFSVLYGFVLLTAAVPTTFVYIFLIFIIIIPYGDMKLCYITGGIALLSNIISIGFVTGSLTSADLAMVEIQVISIALSAFFSGLATNVIGKANSQKIDELHEEKDKTDNLLSNTLEVSAGISEDIASVTERMERLEQSVSTTSDSMRDVSSGTNETSEALQKQLLQTEEIIEQIDKAKNVTDTITNDVQQTENTITIGKENIEYLLSSVNHSESAS